MPITKHLKFQKIVFFFLLSFFLRGCVCFCIFVISKMMSRGNCDFQINIKSYNGALPAIYSILLFKMGAHHLHPM